MSTKKEDLIEEYIPLQELESFKDRLSVIMKAFSKGFSLVKRLTDADSSSSSLEEIIRAVVDVLLSTKDLLNLRLPVRSRTNPGIKFAESFPTENEKNLAQRHKAIYKKFSGQPETVRDSLGNTLSFSIRDRIVFLQEPDKERLSDFIDYISSQLLMFLRDPSRVQFVLAPHKESLEKRPKTRHASYEYWKRQRARRKDAGIK
jgi:mRNA-degrading endonuclease HigB of HigAB toxin-antitoxin module